MAVWTLWLGALASAETLKVGPGGAHTLQEALLEADPGDVIQLSAGSYGTEGFSVPTGITLQGAGREDTHIFYDGDVAGSDVVNVRQVRDVVIQDLTLSGSDIDRVVFVQDAGLTLERVAVEDGGLRGNELGGLLYALRSDIEMREVVFDGGGSAALLGGLAYVQSSALTVDGGTFQNGSSNDDGGAIFATGSVVSLVDVVFSGNGVKSGGGGAIMFKGGPTDRLSVQRGTFDRNHVDDFTPITDRVGGAIHVSGGQASIHDTVFEGNISDFSGGAVALSFVADAEVVGCTFRDNIAAAHGGAVAVYQPQHVRLVGNDIRNSVTNDIGGALYITGQGDFEVVGNRICGSSSGNGGAIGIFAGNEALFGQVRNNLLIDSTGLSSGASLLAWGEAHLDVFNNTIHLGDSPLGSIRVGTKPTVTFVNNVLTDHDVAVWDESGRFSARFNAYWNNVQDTTGVVDSSPVMAPNGFGDTDMDCDSTFLPMVDGPLVDAGDPAVFDDDGSRSDIGAHGGPGASSVLDLDGDGVIEGDCDPYDPTRSSPEAEVIGDGRDQDCDGLDLCYVDGDDDGVGGPLLSAGACSDLGLAATTGDCDDADPSRTNDCTIAQPAPNDAPDSWFCALGAGSWGGGAGLGCVVLMVAARRRRP